MLQFIQRVLNKLNIKVFNDLISERIQYQEILNAGYAIKNQELYYSIVALDFNLILRKNSSDLMVFKQIIMHEEYLNVINIIKSKNIKINNIVDLGSNIGLSAIFFNTHFPHAKIISVEPDPGNYETLQTNIKNNNISNVEFLNAGVWYTNTQLNIEQNFRDKKDWSITVKEVDHASLDKNSIRGITIENLMHQYSLETIDLLKIDIEGAERFIFDEKISSIQFLNNVKVLAIELHEEYVDRVQFENNLIKYGFSLFHSGELTIGVNTSLIDKN